MLAGDRPLVQYGATPFIQGQLLLGARPIGSAAGSAAGSASGPVGWFHLASANYSSSYTAGAMMWRIDGVAGGAGSVTWTVHLRADLPPHQHSPARTRLH